MKAKMTDYKGVYFRSRLEARWCEFFEFLGVRFEYEPARQSTSIGGYIPDFYFRSLKTWVEIKGVKPTKQEIVKLEDVCKKTKRCGLIISNYPKIYPFGVEPHASNCTCYFISSNGVSVFLSLDEIYQITKNTKILHILDKCKASDIVGLNFHEWLRYKALQPAKAKFKPNKTTVIASTKYICSVFSKLSERLNNRVK